MDVDEMTQLPIEPTLPALEAALRTAGSAVLEAPPGTGKTTRVPLALLEAEWLEGRRIVLLEPRRLAARAAARRMAEVLGEGVGDTVGYRIRLDTRVGPRTRIEVVTEGVLTRMLQADPALEGVGLVIFDEFHERNLHAELGLALCLQAREVLRPDLRILVMSATLDGDRVAGLLGGAPVVRGEARSWPVETRWLERRAEGPVEAVAARVIRRALEEESGDVLVFLPGAREIRRTATLLREAGPLPGVRIAPLHGELPEADQDRAIAPSRPGERKVVLATSIAETSLTIEGVRVVVDSGLARVPRFSPRTGMSRLETVPVSRASADQRRGRAGRLGPGVCYRLWTEAEDRGLAPERLPEILETDLAPLALELAAWGVSDPAELAWLDPPPAATFAQARELLARLGALGADGSITAHGRAMIELGLHPRRAHMVLRGLEIGHGGLACDLAALLGGRDVLRRADGPPEADVRLRLEALQSARRAGGRPPEWFRGHEVHVGSCRRVLAEARHLRRRVGVDRPSGSPPAAASGASPAAIDDACGLLLAFAFPDRIARRRPGRRGRYLLRNGRGGALLDDDPLAAEDWIVVAEVNDAGRDGSIALASPLDIAEFEAIADDPFESEDEVAWDGEARRVRAVRRVRLGAIVVRESALEAPAPEAVLGAVLDGIRREGLDLLPWSDAARRLRQRLNFLHRLDPAWPDVSDAALEASLEEWLGPHLHGVRSADELRRLDLVAVLSSLVPWELRGRLDAWAPDRVEVPSGSRIAVDYTDPESPVLAVRLQEVFGWREAPRLGGGRVPLTLHLLSPAGRPVQVTRDLESFWRNAYFQVRKDLRGRYPKHFWPEDPLTAEATRHVRPRARGGS